MKRYLTLTVLLLLCVVLAGTAHAHKAKRHHKVKDQESSSTVSRLDINTDGISPYDLLYFAQSLIGSPYRESSSDEGWGFDCSGFVSYVFKYFNANIPHSSAEFANIGRGISIEDARPGDIILFTGTKTHHPHSIGHSAIVYSNEGGVLRFIHSTSGKEKGVTISDFDERYKRRFVKVVRILSQNDAFQAQAQLKPLPSKRTIL